MVESERHQLLGMFNFIASKKIGLFLENHDWLNFALKYNGPAAVKLLYSQKLETAFETFVATSPPDIEVRIAQLGLTFLDINPGGIDGVFGKNSRKAMQRFQATEGLPTTTILTTTSSMRSSGSVGAAFSCPSANSGRDSSRKHPDETRRHAGARRRP